MGEKKTGLKARLVEEMKTMLLLFIYLAALFCAFATYRMLLSAEYRIAYFRYGYALVEALVLSKVILLGRMLRVGERFGRAPLIVPTVYKTLCFSVFVLAFTILEHLLTGLLRGEDFQAVVAKILSQGIWEILAHVLVLFVALGPLFAIWETGRFLGEGRLFEAFFKRRAAVKADDSGDPATTAETLPQRGGA